MKVLFFICVFIYAYVTLLTFQFINFFLALQWDEDVNELKAKVKDLIEDIAKSWTRKERDECINATMDAFKGGGAINGYLSGGRNSHQIIHCRI